MRLVRDLTDTMYNPAMPPYVDHFRGTELVTRHVEEHCCASVLSSDLTGMPPFAFRGAPQAKVRPPMVMIGQGSAALCVSKLALGCFAFGGDHETAGHLGKEMAALHSGVWGPQDDADTFATVKAALHAGINLFDTAEMYGAGYSERVLGRALKASGWPRSSYCIATKLSETNLSATLVRKHVLSSIERLDCDYIDLIQIHWHSRAAVKSEHYPERPLLEEVPLEETLGAIAQLRDDGLVRHCGVCNFGCRDLTRALECGVVPIVSNQICYNLLWRNAEHELLPLCKARGVAVLAWAPLASALLTGKFPTIDEVPAGRARSRLFCGVGEKKRAQTRHGEQGLEEQTARAMASFAQTAASLAGGVPLANMALSWLRQNELVTCTLVGARTAEQLQRNLCSLELELTADTLKQLDEAGQEVKLALGANLDPYEGASLSRMQ